MDFLKVDTKTIQMTEGAKQAYFVVIGNPCKTQTAIPMQAPDVNCGPNQELVRATLSDHGYVIIGMFFEPGIDGHSNTAVQKSNQAEFAPMCQSRADAGHNSGMGMIFREVAAINPIPLPSATHNHVQNPPVASEQIGQGMDQSNVAHGGTSPASDNSIAGDTLSNVACMQRSSILALLAFIKEIL
jgi:hypothetical protein